MSLRARIATPWLLVLCAVGLGGPGCRRGAAAPAEAAAPAVARTVMQTRTAGAHAEPPAETTLTRDAIAGEPVRVVPEAAPEGATPEDPNAGCVATVDDLPSPLGLDLHDARLRRKGLLVAVKSSRRLMLFSGGTLEACWRIGLGFAPTGHKEVEGDGRTPEGWYATSDKPWSSFDDAIAIHYPNAADAAAAFRERRISRRQRDLIAEATARREVPPQHTPMGGAVLIHGGGSSTDWTLGCIALSEADLADVRARLPRRMRTDLLVLP